MSIRLKRCTFPITTPGETPIPFITNVLALSSSMQSLIFLPLHLAELSIDKNFERFHRLCRIHSRKTNRQSTPFGTVEGKNIKNTASVYLVAVLFENYVRMEAIGAFHNLCGCPGMNTQLVPDFKCFSYIHIR